MTNGTMEDGTTGWTSSGGTLTSATNVAHGGSRSLLNAGRTSAWQGPHQNVTARLTNGKSYTTSSGSARRAKLPVRRRPCPSPRTAPTPQ
ncbi:carbohydrate binding domain-containing protein [Streptomyces sp. NPDC052236]|uniref:carbohydrate binding domain-containing protein n=1 Tax=Streptomyces sp. NPDC052236 TaxID=3365686 RepID=UPI0037D1F714